jgi:uncharacterized circularly permuted ATP-grasp superfamily protein
VSSLNGYGSGTYDDAVAADGGVRPEARAAMDAVLACDLAELGDAVRAEIDGRGIRFGSVVGDDRWHVDPVPRVIAGADWDAIAAGLEQRVRALEAFVADVYGERRIVAEGVVPERVLASAGHHEPALRELGPRSGRWIGIAGLDLVRDPDGRWLVLEDNVRTPSGFGYWSAVRDATLRRVGGDARPRTLDGLPQTLRHVLGDGRLIVLTDGPDNSAHWEHAWTAEALRVPLVTPAELELRDGALLHDGEPVDCVYRRTDDDELASDVGRLLEPALRAGAIDLVNHFGTGVADDKLVHAYVPDIIRFHLGEDPLLEQVETFDLGDPRTLERALDVFDELVVKDRSSYGGVGVVICPHAERADVEELRGRVRDHPEDFIAQRLVGLSTHPTIVDGALVPRHVDLRPFVFLAPDGAVDVTPGGITRVALDAGALVVNSSQNGGAKDTWVMA